MDDLQALIGCLPLEIAKAINSMEDQGDLLEIVIDLGREPSVRFREGERRLTGLTVST
jgi:stage III sporulation protein SpoIIIAA